MPWVNWQVRHGWPQLEMGDAVAAEDVVGWLYLPVVVVSAGIVGGLLVCFGTWRLLRSPHLRPYRFLGWTAIAVTGLFMISGGRPYYAAGFYGLLFAVASVEWCRERVPGRRSTALVYAVSAVAAACVLPLAPASAVQRFDVVSSGSIGWPQVTSLIVGTARRHSAQAVRTDDYWSASTLHHFRPDQEASEVYSPSRGFWYLGRPPENVRRAIYVGSSEHRLRQYFGSVRRVDTVDTRRTGHAGDTRRTGHAGDTPLRADTRYEGMPIYLVGEPRQPWNQLWPRMRWMTLDRSIS